jgi:hypothetical protein
MYRTHRVGSLLLGSAAGLVAMAAAQAADLPQKSVVPTYGGHICSLGFTLSPHVDRVQMRVYTAVFYDVGGATVLIANRLSYDGPANAQHRVGTNVAILNDNTAQFGIAAGKKGSAAFAATSAYDRQSAARAYAFAQKTASFTNRPAFDRLT